MAGKRVSQIVGYGQVKVNAALARYCGLRASTIVCSFANELLGINPVSSSNAASAATIGAQKEVPDIKE